MYFNDQCDSVEDDDDFVWDIDENKKPANTSQSPVSYITCVSLASSMAKKHGHHVNKLRNSINRSSTVGKGTNKRDWANAFDEDAGQKKNGADSGNVKNMGAIEVMDELICKEIADCCMAGHISDGSIIHSYLALEETDHENNFSHEVSEDEFKMYDWTKICKVMDDSKVKSVLKQLKRSPCKFQTQANKDSVKKAREVAHRMIDTCNWLKTLYFKGHVTEAGFVCPLPKSKLSDKIYKKTQKQIADKKHKKDMINSVSDGSVCIGFDGQRDIDDESGDLAVEKCEIIALRGSVDAIYKNSSCAWWKKQKKINVMQIIKPWLFGLIDDKTDENGGEIDELQSEIDTRHFKIKIVDVKTHSKPYSYYNHQEPANRVCSSQFQVGIYKYALERLVYLATTAFGQLREKNNSSDEDESNTDNRDALSPYERFIELRELALAWLEEFASVQDQQQEATVPIELVLRKLTMIFCSMQQSYIKDIFGRDISVVIRLQRAFLNERIVAGNGFISLKSIFELVLIPSLIAFLPSYKTFPNQCQIELRHLSRTHFGTNLKQNTTKEKEVDDECLPLSELGDFVAIEHLPSQYVKYLLEST